MTNKHPNYEFIVAFAEGKEVEYKLKGLDGAWDVWEKANNISLFSNTIDYEFRLKPENKKTTGYRRYIDEGYSSCFVETCVENIGSQPETIEKIPSFICWLDTEWQYAEYEAKE